MDGLNKPDQIEILSSNDKGNDSIPETPKVDVREKEVADNSEDLEKIKKAADSAKKLSKALSKIVDPKKIKDSKARQFGVNIRIDGNGKLIKDNKTPTITNTRVARRINSMVIELEKLHTKIESGNALTDEEIKAIQQNRSLIKAEEDSSSQWQGGIKEDKEFKAAVLLGKSMVNSATRQGEKDATGEVKPDSFDEKLTEVAKKAEFPADLTEEETAKDFEIAQEKLEEVKQSLTAILLTKYDAQEVSRFIDQLGNFPEFTLVLRALQKGAIEISDIPEDELVQIYEHRRSSTDKETVESPQTSAREKLIEGLTENELVGRLLEGTDLTTAAFTEAAEFLTSNEIGPVRARLDSVTQMLDLLTSSITAERTLSTEDIDNIFDSFNLLPPKNADKATQKNYEQATVMRETYLRMLEERGQKLLTQQEVRLHALAELANPELQRELSDFEQTLQAENSSLEKAKRITEFINGKVEQGGEQSQEIERATKEALKVHFLNEIFARQGVTKAIPQDIDIEWDPDSGYYLLKFKNQSDFDDITNTHDNIGAACKFDNVYLVVEQGPTTEPEKEEETPDKAFPSKLSVGQRIEVIKDHELVHLGFEEVRQASIKRERIFAAKNILNVLIKEGQVSEENRDKLYEAVVEFLTLSGEERRVYAETNEILKHLIPQWEQASSYIEDTKETKPSPITDDQRKQLPAIKVARLIKYSDSKFRELTAQDPGKNYRQVEELAAEMTSNLVEEGSKLNLGSIGINQGEEFILYTTKQSATEQGRVSYDFNVHNIEAANMLRVINAAIEKVPEEQRQEVLKKWVNRIMQFREFNQVNTLTFIFELLEEDGINPFEGEEDSDLGEVEAAYFQIANRYKDGAFSDFVFEQLNQGKLGVIKSREELEQKIANTYKLYKKIVSIGLAETDDIASQENRTVENDLFKFASRPQYDGLIALHKNEGRVGHPYSAAWPGGINHFMEQFFGMKVKDVTEKGLLFKWGKEAVRDSSGKITGWRRVLRHGADATLMPIKPASNLPFGLGEKDKWIKWFGKTFGKKNESFLSPEYMQRTGVEQLSMDIKDMFSLLADGIASRLSESLHYLNQDQIYNLMYDRVGLVYFEGGKMSISYEGLKKHRDAYLASHLYMQTDRNGNFVTGGRISAEGRKIYEDLKAKGYRGLDLHLLMEAHNDIQQFSFTTGAPVNINAEDFPITLGTVTVRTAERTKLMRSGGADASKDDNKMNGYIAQGKEFDEISRFVMELEHDSWQKARADGVPIENMRLYTIEDVIKAIEKVDVLRPGEKGTETVEDWNKSKSKVKLEFGGKSMEFNRDTLKEYVRCYFYGRTYEAMALGLYGETEVIRLQGGAGSATDEYFEIIEGYGITSDEDREARIQEVTKIWNDAEKNYKSIYDTQHGVGEYDKEKLANPANMEINVKIYRDNLISSKGLRLKSIRVAEIPAEYQPGQPKEIKQGKRKKYKKPGQDIFVRLPGALTLQRVKAKEGLKKEEMNLEFGDFTQHKTSSGLGSTDPNAYTLSNIEGKLINKVEDVIGEKKSISSMYFYLRQLMVQADDYRVKSSENKEKWLGIARLNMIWRWVHTGLTIGALVAFPPALAGLFINPWMIVWLLGNYFLIGNWMTKQADLWGKRKSSAIAAVNKLKELEPTFEKAFFDPKFSLGPERQRIYQLCKVAEDILKGALVTSVDTPSNLIEDSLKNLYEGVKDMK